MQETEEMWVQSLGREDPLEEEMATHSTFLPGEFLDRRAWWATVHGAARGGQDLATNTPPRDLPDPGIEPTSLLSLALAGGSLPLVPPGKPTDQHNPELKNARVLMKGTVPTYIKSDTLSPWQCSLEVADTFKKDSAGDTEMRVWPRA